MSRPRKYPVVTPRMVTCDRCGNEIRLMQAHFVQTLYLCHECFERTHNVDYRHTHTPVSLTAEAVSKNHGREKQQ